MKRAFLLVLILITAINLAACTNVTVKRVVTGNEAGLRYYLPQPVIIVTPQEDGTMQVRVESIADRSEAYSVSAKSWFASYKLVLKHSQGLLTEVSLTSDSSAVAAESVKAAGEVKKSKIEAETEANQKAFEKQETAAKERRDELKKLQESLAQAQIEAAQAAAALEALKDTTDETKKLEAKIAKEEADAKVRYLQEQLRKFGQVGSGSYSLVEGDRKKLEGDLEKARIEAAKAAAALEALKKTKDEEAKAEAGEAKKEADAKVRDKLRELENAGSKFKDIERPGPVILLVKEDAQNRDLQLVPLSFGTEPQKMFASYEGPPKTTVQKPGEPLKKIEFEKSSVSVKSGGKIDIRTKNDFAILTIAMMTRPQGPTSQTLWPTVTRKDSKTFELEFKADTPSDTYKISFLGKVEAASPPIDGEIEVKVE